MHYNKSRPGGWEKPREKKQAFPYRICLPAWAKKPPAGKIRTEKRFFT